MTKTLDCPNCGAPLENIQPGSQIIKCPFCHSTVLLPDELRGAINPEEASGPAGNILEHMPDLKRMAELARSGKQLEAVKLYREIFDTSLTEGKRAIEAVAAGQPVILPGQMKVVSATPSRTELLQKIANLYSNGSALEAIRLFRDTFNASLKQSKDTVEQLVSGGLVTLPDGTIFQLTQGFTNMIADASPASMPVSRRSGGTVGILAVAGMVLGLLAALTALIFTVIKEKEPEALIAPISTVTPSPTPTVVPFAAPLFTFGGEGSGAGLFSDARYIGVDNHGGIYVGDIETRLVQVFDPDGNFVTQWHTGKKDNSRDLFMAGMAVDLNGLVYIASSDGLYIFDGQSGERMGKLTQPGDGYFEAVCTAPDGSILALYFTQHENVVRFDRNGQSDLYIESPIGNVTDHSELDTSVAVDGIGNIYLLGSFNNLAFIYNRDGKYQNKFGGEGEGPGTFQAVDAIAVDNQSRIYISDVHGLQVFDPNERYLETFEIQPDARAMAFDLKGDLYILDFQGVITKYHINH